MEAIVKSVYDLGQKIKSTLAEENKIEALEGLFSEAIQLEEEVNENYKKEIDVEGICPQSHLSDNLTGLEKREQFKQVEKTCPFKNKKPDCSIAKYMSLRPYHMKNTDIAILRTLKDYILDSIAYNEIDKIREFQQSPKYTIILKDAAGRISESSVDLRTNSSETKYAPELNLDELQEKYAHIMHNVFVFTSDIKTIEHKYVIDNFKRELRKRYNKVMNKSFLNGFINDMGANIFEPDSPFKANS